MLTSSVHTASKPLREESVLRELSRFSYCPRCRKPCCASCPACGEAAFLAVVYLHNVPKVNGLPEDDDECAACRLTKQPQKAFNELRVCERELDGVIAGAKSEQELID